MNWTVIIPVVFGMLLLSRRRTSILVWSIVWWLAIYIILSFGFATPVPASVIWLYMGIVTGVILLYVTSSEEKMRAFRDPLVRFLVQPRYTIFVIAMILLIPSIVATSVYFRLTAPVRPPFFARTIHPANPDQITAFGRQYNLVTLDNPLRRLEQTDPGAFARHVQAGREIYYRNCFYCHGDDLRGTGLIAHALNPIPTNLEANIDILQESFLFWRIAKGAPGLPEEGGPWESAMPAWEQFLTEEEIWQVILFLYDFTDLRPRARHEGVGE
ncbi:MAG TPA: cytochrome c [Acidobacteriota bacterium]|nr:cytochrome c [Acidobacteriota bacterium]